MTLETLYTYNGALEVRRNCFSLRTVVILVAYVVLQNRRLHLINAFIPHVCWSLCVFKILEIYILEHEEKAGGCLHLNDLKPKIRLIRYASLLNIEFYMIPFPPRLCIYYMVVPKKNFGYYREINPRLRFYSQNDHA